VQKGASGLGGGEREEAETRDTAQERMSGRKTTNHVIHTGKGKKVKKERNVVKREGSHKKQEKIKKKREFRKVSEDEREKNPHSVQPLPQSQKKQERIISKYLCQEKEGGGERTLSSKPTKGGTFLG